MSINLFVATQEGAFSLTGTNATAALAAIRAHKMIDAMAVAEGEETEVRTQIPYSSVVIAQYTFEADETEVEDDNCKVRVPEAEAKPEPDPEPDPEPGQ